MARNLPRSRMAAIATLAALAIAGCGGGEDDGGDAPAQGGRQAADAGGIVAIVREVSPSIVAVRSQTTAGVGEGSGVVWDGSTVVTNAHVVRDADEVELALASGERIDARVEATDPLTDLAVLVAERDDLPAATFADAVPPVGSQAIAIGNPLGFEDTITAGIVSGVDRHLPTGGRTPSLVGLVQTDAAISPGNSGGALVGADGEVIGVNVAYVPPQTPAVSIGFAIPAPEVAHVVGELLDSGDVEHAFVGIDVAPVTRTLAERLGVETRRGAAVLEVSPGSPAASAGMEPGDVIVEIAGERVTQVEDLYAALRERSPGDRLQMTILRGGERQAIELTLAARE